MHFGWGKLPKIKTRYCGHLFGLCGRVISHWGKGQDGREYSMKVNLINHADRQRRTEPSLPRTVFGNLGNGGEGAGWGNVVVPNYIYFFEDQMKTSDG